jgi:hypothetical protein
MKHTKPKEPVDFSKLSSIEEAAQKLGKGFGPTTLRGMIRTGELKEGEEWYDLRRPSSTRARIWIDCEAVKSRYSKPAAFRNS